MSVYRSRPARNGRPRPARRAAFYDLDGTLADLNLVHAALFVLANLGEWTGRAGYLLSFAARLPRLYFAEQRDRRLLNTVLFDAFKGISGDRLAELGEEYCDRVLIGHLYPQAVDMLEANRAAGLDPVLVTGSPDFIVAPLARHLRIAEFVANRLAMVGGRATGRLAEPVMAAEEKAAWCASFAAARNFDLGACWAYADSHYDLPFLAAVGHPVAVNPSSRLRAAARGRQWPILHFARNDDAESAGFDDDSVADSAEERLRRRSDGAA